MPVETVPRRAPQRGPQVAAARKRKGLTQQQLADALGINRVSLARVEAGTRSPSMDLALRIAGMLGESVDSLLREWSLMARPATGQIVERRGTDGNTYRSLRFRSGGRRHTVPLGVVSRADAERELACVMADVTRGLWKPATIADAPPEIPTFHEYAEDWWLRNSGQLAAKTQTDYRWRLEGHLIPHFGKLPLDAITFDTVERYIAAKLAHGERIRAAEGEGKPIIEHFTTPSGANASARRSRSPRGR